MSRATLISRIVFALLVVATFTAFFAAQKLKRTDPLVNSVNLKRYVSPNNDGVRDRARLRFRIKQDDVVTVEVIDRNGDAVRTLADDKPMRAGPQRFQWNGRYAPANGERGNPVPDGAYRVRITMRNAGRTFIPDKYFVVDTTQPKIEAEVVGTHSVSLLAQRPSEVTVKFSGVAASRRVEMLVYRVRGNRTDAQPVATFASDRGENVGRWNLQVDTFRKRRTACFGRFKDPTKGRAAPAGSYVIVVRACDAAGNAGVSSSELPPRRGTTNGLAGVTLNGVEIAPPTKPAMVGTVASFDVTAPRGGYSYRLSRVGGGTVKRGRERGNSLRLSVPRVPVGLYELRIDALRPVPGGADVARTPVVVSSKREQDVLIAFPAIAWQATNPVDVTGDGFADPFQTLPPGQQLRVPIDRKLASPDGPPRWRLAEGALADFVANDATVPAYEATTDFALGTGDATSALRGRKAVFFAGDERWITPQLGSALRKFVADGGRVAFFAPDAFRRTVRISGSVIAGPSDRRQRDIFGEATKSSVVAPAPIVSFADQLGLFQSQTTGQFTDFEQSDSRPRAAEVLTAGGREEGKPALVAYRLGKGLVIRVGVPGWQAELRGTADQNVAYTTRAILAELAK